MKSSKNIYHRFNLTFLAVTLPGLLGFGTFNILVDGSGIFNSPKIANFNELKPAIYSHVRLFKAVGVSRKKPKNIILGSSRSDIGLDPDHPSLASDSAYNLALVGPNMYEVRRYFEHALANQPELKTVVLGIDFFMFNENWHNSPDFDEARLGRKSPKIQDLINASLSLDALDLSKQTVGASVESDAYYLYKSNGLRYVYGNKPDEPLKVKFEKMLTEFLRGERAYPNYKSSQSFLNDFRLLVETCKEKNIDLKVFISPIHVTQLEAINTAGVWSEFEDWKRQVVEITPVWDFSGYNSITTEPISNQMKNYWDSSHYRKEVGDLILNRLFEVNEKVVPEDFGTLLTTHNIESELEKRSADRVAWEKNDPDLLKFVQNLQRQASSQN
ncbi:hypothetical protein [Lyngbya aestuarii]|uniref:hypothetical protein n=1 Tax=Lyngbya aestuarii TaxID=118322 RepID=UPI00403DE5BB